MEIDISDFQKIDLKVGKIESSEKIKNSEKLVKLIVDIGDKKIQLVAGIALSYKPEELIGKKIIVLTNLKPRKIFGIESQGMLLAAHDKNNFPVLLTVDKDVEAGAKIS
jgi:methionine--tRNA ligase beta chain